MTVAYNEPLSHLMQAGSDALIVPSRFEPCGLTQLYALRYGCIPIVARTGASTTPLSTQTRQRSQPRPRPASNSRQ